MARRNSQRLAATLLCVLAVGALFGTGVAHAAPTAKPGDFNGDGKSDILIRDGANGLVYGWLMDGVSIASGGYVLDAGTGWTPVRTLDLNGDLKDDLLIQHTDGSLYAWIMDGLIVTGGGYLLGAGSGWSVSHTGDFNGDGKADILLRHTDGSIYVWLMDGFAITSGTFLQGAGTGWSATHVADFNGDGKSDILLKHTDGSIYVWQMNGIAIQAGAFLKGAGIDWSPTATGDFNGDFKADILITHANGGVYLWQMNGTAIQNGAYLLSPGSGWAIARTADLNGDSRTDIIISHTDGSHYAWIMNGLTVAGGGYLLGAGTGWSVTHTPDLNADGRADILLKHTDGSIYAWTMDGASITGGAYLMGAGTYSVVPAASITLNCSGMCFLERYAADGSIAPSPASAELGLSTQLQKGDVAFIVDTTGSMGGSIASLKSGLSTTVIPALRARIPSLGVGVAAHDDFPYSTYGVAGDSPFYFPLVPEGYVTTTTANSQTAANALTTHNGNDGPEAHLPAIYHALTGSGLTWPGGSVAAVTPPAGTFGAMRFRSDALPIVINITDIGHHNGKRALDKTGTAYDSAYQSAYSFTTYNVDQVVATLNSLGAKFIGVSADNGARAVGSFDPYGYHAYITDKTGSNVTPAAFAGGTCKTGVSGATVAADGPTIGGVQQCRSVFSINTSGTGLSTSIVDGVSAILNSVKFDVYVQAYNDPAETLDVVGNFILKVEPDAGGGTDPVTGAVCVTFPPAQLADNFTGPKAQVAGADGSNDTITQVNPGQPYCFNVIPKANTTVAATASTQTFRAWIRVLAIRPGGGTYSLGPDREVRFVVPPIGS